MDELPVHVLKPQDLPAIYDGGWTSYAVTFPSESVAFKLVQECFGTGPTRILDEDAATYWPNATNTNNVTPLMALAAFGGHGTVEKARKLLAHPLAGVNMQDAEGNTALHLAATRANQDMIRLLQKHKANAAIKNAAGRTPIDIAAETGCADLFVKPGRRDRKAAENGPAISMDISPDPVAPVESTIPKPKENMTDEQWVAFCKFIQKQFPGSDDVMTMNLEHILKDGDHPKAVHFLLRNGADATASWEVPPTLLSETAKYKKGNVWDMALLYGRKESFRQICLWTSKWRKKDNMKKLDKSICRAIARKSVFNLAAMQKVQKDDTLENRAALEESSREMNDAMDWMLNSCRIAKLRETYSGVDTKILSGVFKGAVWANRFHRNELDLEQSMFAELMTERKTLWSKKIPMNDVTFHASDQSTLLARALLADDYIFADDIAANGLEHFGMDVDLGNHFKEDASDAAKAWLDENMEMNSTRIKPQGRYSRKFP